MEKFRKRQRRFKALRNACVIVTAAAFLLYITFEPTLTKTLQKPSLFQLLLFAMVAVTLALLFLYEAKFGKAERYADDMQLKIDDAGYYLSAREEETSEAYFEAMVADLTENGFRLQKDVSYDGLTFDAVAVYHSEMVYIVKTDSADKNDVIAYTDAAVNDITSRLLKRKGNAIVVLLCELAEDSAIAVSKTYTQLYSGRRATLSVYPVIAEIPSKRVYCLGNKISPAQKLITAYVMNCELPVKEQYICRDKLPFQLELEEKMRHFDYKSLSQKEK